MTWTTEIIDSITQIDPGEWDYLAKNQPFADWRWLQFNEIVLANHQPRYVLLRQNANLRAGIVSALQQRFQNPRFQSMLGWAVHRFPGLRCGVPLSCDPGLFIDNPNSSTDLLPKLMQGLETLIQRERISYHTIDHIWPSMPLWEFLQPQGYHRIEHLAEIYLDIHWTSVDDYLLNLPKKKRKEYRRVGRRLDESGITLAVADPQIEDGLVLQNLVDNVFRHHQEPNPYVNNLFLEARKIMGKDFKLIVARQDGQLIGCIALLRSENQWLVKWPGLDYERTWDTGTYYGLLAECVRQTILAGGQRLRMGATGYQTKRHFGAVEESRIGAFAFRPPFIHYLAGKALQIATALGTSGPIAEAPKYTKESKI